MAMAFVGTRFAFGGFLQRRGGVFDSSVFHNNSLPLVGGAIYSKDGIIQMQRSAFLGNEASYERGWHLQRSVCRPPVTQLS